MFTHTHRYIFFADEGQASVLEFNPVKREFTYLKRDGERVIDLADDFWEWWKSVAEYEAGDSVDFCIISDQEYPVLYGEKFPDTIQPEASQWKMEVVRAFFEEMVLYASVDLITSDQEKFHFRKEKVAFGGKLNINKTFYANISGQNGLKEEEQKKETSGSLKSEEEATEFIQFFRNLKMNDLNR